MSSEPVAKILYVEDDEAVREMTRDILTSSGYEVVAASNAEAALAALAMHSHFDLLLTDLGLPGMDGRELVQRAQLNQADLRVVLVTGYGGADAASLTSPNTSLLQKPFTLRELLHSVRQAL